MHVDRPWHLSIKYTALYATFGAGFGVLFPVAATIVQLSVAGVDWTAANAFDIHTATPINYIIDTVPVFFLLFGAAAGWRQDSVEQILHALQVASDKLRKTNDELERRNADLIEANLLKSQFLANTSHEFRTPLNAIIGFSRLVMRKGEGVLPPRQLKNLARIHESGHHLLEMVDNLLDIERVESGELALRLNDVDIIELAAAVVDKLTPRATEKSLKLVFAPPVDQLVIRTDPARVRQILDNFVANAIKYSDEGTVEVQLTFDDNTLELRIVDEGIGIADDHLQRIFERFYQVEGGDTRTRDGVGLGLNVVQKLAEALGGTVGVESELGVGSRFYLRLPRADRSASRENVPAQASEQHKPQPAA